MSAEGESFKRAVEIDLIFRGLAAAVTAWFVYRVGLNYYLHDRSRITTLLLLVSEVVSLIVIIASRRPSFRDSNILYAVLTVFASFVVPVFILPKPQTAIVPEAVSSVMAMTGALWTIYAKLSLGRSFGLVAARRIIKEGGAYRLVRHPIYIGYFIIHIAFLLENFTLANGVIIVALYCAQILRALREESILSAEPSYRAYCARTRYRFIYGVI